MNWHLLVQLILSLGIVACIWVLCSVYYFLGVRGGHQIGVMDGAEYAKQVIIEAIKAEKVTLDGKQVRIVEPQIDAPPATTESTVQNSNSQEIKIDGCLYDMDGNQYTCKRPDFVNLAESLCGFGDTPEQAKADLLKSEAENWKKE